MLISKQISNPKTDAALRFASCVGGRWGIRTLGLLGVNETL
ncbi:MAG: hypothetical protein US89_C0004G0088 [Candidatus Peregrinibacteria bacterium GW2011_GWF2_38_29]|nr:MAG: hypothetical protein US89_C0004G0088 [Candidatus Peregrinibacteria bacterium GW2011_GWF2_38_29]